MKHILKNFFPALKAAKAKIILTGTAMIMGFSLFAQNIAPVVKSSPGVFTNPIFLALLSVIILLMIITIVLANVLTGVAEASIKPGANKKILGAGAVILLMTQSTSAFSQTVNTEAMSLIPQISSSLFYTLISVIAFEILIIIVLLNAIRLFTLQKEKIRAAKVTEPSLLEKLNASVAIEKEEEIMFDHVYDGIRELDNDLPPWWKYGFYLTIVFAVAYMVHYHVISTGDLQTAEYDKSIAKAKVEKEEFAKNNANNVNENNAEMLTDKAEIAKGEAIYKDNCVACHGRAGEGGVGPNLTDEYWLHGGSIKNIFSTIKYGWPEKGMKAWQGDFSPVQIHEIASYIKTLKGTNPPNAKEKQGDLFTEGASTAVDSTITNNSKDSVVQEKTSEIIGNK
jgi:cytochrome c oxidase cbb3-type subunit III